MNEQVLDFIPEKMKNNQSAEILYRNLQIFLCSELLREEIFS